jgi:hypothetical protein
MRKYKCVAGLSVMLVLALGSCDIGKLFSTSLAKDSNRLSSATVGSAEDAKFLLKQAEGDPAASKALLDTILKAAEGKSGTEQQGLLGAAAVAAVQASDIGGLVLGAVADVDIEGLSNGEGSTDEYVNLVTNLVDSAAGLGDIADDLASAFAAADAYTDTGSDAELSYDTLAAMGAPGAEQDTALGLLALTLITGLVQPGVDSDTLTQYAGDDASFQDDPSVAMEAIFGDNITIPTTGTGEDEAVTVDDIIDANPSLKLLNAAVNSISEEPDDPIAKMLKDLWKSMKGDPVA